MITPHVSKAENWFEMFARDTAVTERIYLENCMALGMIPRRDVLDAIIDADEQEMLASSTDALRMSRFEAETAIVAKRVLWRRSPHPSWRIEIQLDGGEWRPVILKPPFRS